MILFRDRNNYTQNEYSNPVRVISGHTNKTRVIICSTYFVEEFGLGNIYSPRKDSTDQQLCGTSFASSMKTPDIYLQLDYRLIPSGILALFEVRSFVLVLNSTGFFWCHLSQGINSPDNMSLAHFHSEFGRS